VVEKFLEEHPANKLVATNRSGVVFAHGENGYSVEELVAMQLVNIKGQAELMANEKVRELVLTVPAFWTEQERKAIIDAAELAGMRVSTLINDGLAVAIQYGTTRTFPEDPKYHLIYDMGAGSTTATVVSFRSRSVKEGRKNKTVIEIATHGFGYDRELGGDFFNSRIVDTLVDTFRSSKAGSKAKTDITTDGRAFARLFKEAARVKQVLSANAETMASVRPLMLELM
jgi:hypoxia up-regulated 1